MQAHIHILGICGTFMAGIAQIARTAGYKVTGCDANVYPPMSTQLEQQGIQIIDGYHIDQLAIKPDLFLIGNVVKRGNPLMEAILNQGLPYQSAPQWLSENILNQCWVLAVSGTHGKTTTTAMLTWILDYCAYKPSFLVGGVPNNFNISARYQPDSHFFVIEADEYDTAFFDKRSKFIHYHPRTLIINNLEFDHADIFNDLVAIQTQFHHLIRTIPEIGQLIVNTQQDSLKHVLSQGYWSELVEFNRSANYHCHFDMATKFTQFMFQDEVFASCQLPMFGEHNRLNALAAILAAKHVGIQPSLAVEALEKFQGIKRRLQLRGTVAGVRVYDDFAHHPTAIQATIQAVKHETPHGAIHAVFEPRSNTMKIGALKDRLADSLKDADFSYCYTKDLSWDPQSALTSLGNKIQCCSNMDTLLQQILAQIKPEDTVICMSNGSFDRIHERLIQELKLHFSSD